CPIRAHQKWRAGRPMGVRCRPACIAADGGIGGASHSRSAPQRGNMSENPVRARDGALYKKIPVPIDLADPDLAKPAVATALMMAGPSEGMIRFVNVLPLTPVMLAEYVPPDFEVQQRKAAEDALAIVVKETGLPPARVSSTVRQGGIYQEILEEASSMQPDLIVMS